MRPLFPASIEGKRMRRLCLTFLLLACAPAIAQQSYDGPVIDVHLHVGRAAPGAPNYD